MLDPVAGSDIPDPHGNEKGEYCPEGIYSFLQASGNNNNNQIVTSTCPFDVNI
jgi:hypothetical protein